MSDADRLRAALERIPVVRLAVLFGSASRNRLRATSDLDVGVITTDGRDLPPELRVALERETGRRVDLVSLTTAPPLLRFEVAQDGLLLLERTPFAWADFRARAMIDWWDWAPTARMMHRVMKARLEQEAARGPS
jgi:predicted nucleotidyltransferase